MLFKKLIFAPFFLILVTALSYLYKPVLAKHTELFFGTWGGLQEVGLIAAVVILISLTFCLFIIFTQNAPLYLILAFLGSLTPFLFLTPPLAFVACIGFFVSFSVGYFSMMSILKSYTNFQPVTLLSTPVKTLNTMLILSLSVVFYFYSNLIIQTQGFKIPDSILDFAINISLQDTYVPVKGEKYLAQTPTLSKEQLELLKQNPDILEQFGLSSSDLDQYSQPETSQTPSQALKLPNIPGVNLRDTIKTQITKSLDQLIKPYLYTIPILLAFLFYSLASFALWILSFLLAPTILLIFSIFEKTGFVIYTKEMREVKKIII